MQSPFSARPNLYRLLVLLGLAVLAGGSLRAQIRDSGVDPWNLGKGDWIYSMTDATNKLGGHVASVTNETSLMMYYRSIGIRYIMVKAATSDKLFNGCYASPQFTSRLVGIAHTNGLFIFGYNRSYGSNIAGEVAVADYVFNQGADGFVFDAESEWESNQTWIGTTGPAKAWELCSTVRAHWPNKFLAHAPFPIINYHSSFPYKEFGYWCDAVMPQIYHSGWTGVKGSASGGINWSDVNWANWQKSLVGKSTNIDGVTYYWTNAIKPLAPVENVYGPVGQSPCEGTASPLPDKDVMEFIDYLAADPNSVTTGGYQGANFWRADLHGAVQLGHIQAGTLGFLPGRVNNLVVDDPRATVAGAWTAVRTFYNGTFYGDGSGVDTNSFGTNYLAKSRGSGSAYVLYRPNIEVPGDYRLYEWHPRRTNASASVPFIINYCCGSTTIYANQQTNPGNWSLLGRFSFDAGPTSIRVTDAIPEASSVALVDGLKLVFVPPTSTPSDPSNLTANAISSTQINLTWVDMGTNETGYLVYRSLKANDSFLPVAKLGRNNSSFADSGLTPNTAYFYRVYATNYLGYNLNTNTAGATTTVRDGPPSISAGPQDQTVVAGQPFAFSVSATGSLPFAYQWYYNGGPMEGANNNPYTKTGAQVGDSGVYQVVITNAFGAATSAPATLIVGFALTINAADGTVAKNPDLAVYPPGTLVTLTATANSGFVFAGWSGARTTDNNPLPLLVTSNLTLTAAFRSTDLILDNTDAAVTYSGNWQAGAASTDKYGADYRFASTLAGGTSNVTYRPTIAVPGYYDVYTWYPQGSNRATNAPWTVVYSGGQTVVPVDQSINGGGWRLLAAGLPFAAGTDGYVRVSNDTGYSGKVVMADAVRFSYVAPVIVAPSLTQQPQDQVVKRGSNALFSVTATGTPLYYQWRFNGVAVPGATDPSLNLTAVQPSQAGLYSVSVSNAASCVLSSNAQLTLQSPTPPRIEAIRLLSPEVVQLQFSGEPARYSVDGSSNLADWLELTNFTTTNTVFEYLDVVTNSPQRFYRLWQR